MRRRSWLLGIGLASLVVRPAVAEQPDCAALLDAAVSLQRQGKLTAASEQFIGCSQPICPFAIARECTDQYSDIQKIQPSVTLAAKQDGAQLIDVRIFMDGELFAEKLDGRARPVDPGVHEFTFELPGKPPLRVQTLVVEGEKNKPVIAEFSTPAAPARERPTPAAALDQPLSSAAPASRPTPASVYLFGALGVVAVGGGTVLRLLADNEFDELSRDCKPNCTDEDMDPVKSRYLLSHVAFGVGAATLVTASVIYLTRAAKPEATSGLVLTPMERGAFGGFYARF